MAADEMVEVNTVASPWWKKYSWDIRPDDKILLEVNGKTKFIGSPKEDAVLAILPRDFRHKITAFITDRELEKLVSGEIEEVVYAINANVEVVVRKIQSVVIRREQAE